MKSGLRIVTNMSSLDERMLNETKCSVCSSNGSPNGSPNLTENLKERLNNVLHGKKRRSSSTSTVSNSSVIPSDWSSDKETNNNLSDSDYSPSSSAPMSPIFDNEAMEQGIVDEMAAIMHNSLVTAEKDVLGRRIMLPADLLARLSRDIVAVSRSEPYGLRGAVIYIDLDSSDLSSSSGERVKPERLARVECNSHVVATFEVHLTLKEDIKRWCTLKDLVFRGVFGCVEEELYLSPKYELNKKKLYRSSSQNTPSC